MMLATTTAEARSNTAAERAFRLLRSDILGANLRPGEKMRVEHLSEAYGIGATPLREALSRLASTNLVVAEGQRGFRVAPVSVEDLLDITKSRAWIESIALRAAIAAGDSAWEGEILAAAHRLGRIKAPNEEPLSDEWYRENRAFHDALVAACGSSQIKSFRAQLYDLSDRYRRLSVRGGLGGRNFASEHEAIKDAVLRRDTGSAIDLTSEHFIATTKVILASEIAEPQNLETMIARLRTDITSATST